MNPVSATSPAIPTVTSMAYVPSNSPVLPIAAAQSEVGVGPYLSHSSVPSKFVPYGTLTAANGGSAAQFSQPVCSLRFLLSSHLSHFSRCYFMIWMQPLLVDLNHSLL